MPSAQSGISGLAGFVGRTIELRRAERAQQEQQKAAEKQAQIDQLMKMAQTPGMDPQAATGLMQQAAKLAGLKDEDLDAAMGREVQQQMGAPIQPPPSVDPQAAVQARESMTQPENVGKPVTPAPVQAPQAQAQPQVGGVIPEPPMVDAPMAPPVQHQTLTPGDQGSRYDAAASQAMTRFQQRAQATAGTPQYFDVPPDIPEKIGYFSNPAYAEAQKSSLALNQRAQEKAIDAAGKALEKGLSIEETVTAIEDALGRPLEQEEIAEVAGLKVEDTTKKLLSSSEPVSGADLKIWAQASGVEIPDLPDDQMFVAQQFDDGEWGVAPAARPEKEYKTVTPGSTVFEMGPNGWKPVASVPPTSGSGAAGAGDPSSVKRVVELVQRKGIDKVKESELTPEVFRYAAERGIPMPTSKIIGAVQDIEKGVGMAQEVANRLAKVKGYESYAAMAQDVAENPDKFSGFSGMWDRVEGKGQQLKGMAGADPEISAIESIKGSLAVLLARAFGEVGNLAQAEQARALLATPSVSKTPAEVVELMGMLNSLIEQGKEAGKKSSMVDPEEWGVTMIEGDKTPVEDSAQTPTLKPTIKALAEKAAQKARE